VPYANSFISRDNALYALDDFDQPRSYDEFNFTELTDWSSTNSSVSIVLDNREYPLFYVFKILPNNTNPVSFQLSNVVIGGVNITNLNNMNLVGHALIKCDNSLSVNATLGVTSSTGNKTSAKTTTINPGIQTAVRSGSIVINKNKSATITSAYGNGSYVTYYALNTYSAGDSIFISDTENSSFNYTTSPATIQFATAQLFTISNSAVGYVQPTFSYSYKANASIEEISQPYEQYSGENLTASLSFTFTGHDGGAIYLTIPIIADMNRVFSSWATRMSLETTPQVFREIDEISNPTWPMARLIHAVSAGVEDVIDKYELIVRSDPTVQDGFVDVDDSSNKSFLVDPEIALPKYYDWLLQFVGQTRSYSSIASNKCADYGSTTKVRCATTANITISSALNGGDSLDGVMLAEDDRVLVKNQTIASENGIYIVGSSPARWSGMPASSVSIASLSPVTPLLGYSQITTSAAHGFSAGDTVVITGVTPSGHNGEYVIYSVPTTTTFVVESTEVATATLSSATAKRAVDTTNPDLIFVREGTVNKMTMWSPASQGWTGTANESASVTNSRTTSPRTNLVTNPSFGTNATGWTAAQSGAGRNALLGFIGSSSYLATMDSTTDSNIGSTTVTIPETGKFAYSLYVYTPPLSSLAGRTVSLAREAGTATLSSPSSTSATLVGGSWVRCSVIYDVGTAGTATMVARLSGDLSTASGQSVYIDAVLGENSATVGTYFDGSTNPNSRWTGTAHASTSIISGRGNLIVNPSFETETTGWNVTNVTLARVTTDSYVGNASLRITSGSATDTFARARQSTRLTAIAGSPYTASVYLKNTAGNNRQHRISLWWYNSSGTLISTTDSTGTTLNVGGAWQRFTVSGTAPAGTVSVDFVILMQYSNASLSNVTLADACIVEQSSTVSDYFDGYNDDNLPWAIIGEDFINFSVKQLAAKLATTQNIDISTALNNTDTIDGVSLATGDYVLVKNQTTASENGIYQVDITPVRITNMAAGIPLSTGFRAYVWGSGTANTETMFTLDEGGLIGTDTLNFTASVKPFAWDDADEFKKWQLSNKYFGYKAGSLEAIEETVKRYLIGDKQVLIALNPPFEFTIYTLRDETLGIYYTSTGITTSEVINNAISIIKPMGFNVTHSALAAFDTFIIGTSIIGTGRLG